MGRSQVRSSRTSTPSARSNRIVAPTRSKKPIVKQPGKVEKVFRAVADKTPLGIPLAVFDALTPAQKAKLGKGKKRQGIINKRGRKTIRKALRMYKELDRAMKGIEKMAGKAHLRHPKKSFRQRPYRPY